MVYRKEVDGLRALAVIPVILFHAGFSVFSGGFVGVDVFFVISGYLITSIIISERQDDRFSLLRFYERRARRILPALFLVVLACFVAAYFTLLPSDMKSLSRSMVAAVLFSSNLLFWKERGYFAEASELKPLLHTWSLGVEEQYYVLFPLLIMGAWRFGKKALVVAVALLAVASLLVAQWAVLNKPDAAFFLLPTRGWELLMGSLIAFYGTREHNPTLSNIASLAGVLLIACAVFMFDGKMPFPGVYALIPTAGTALILLFANQSTIAGKLLGTKLLVGVGLISFSAYLWHQPVFALLRYRIEPTLVMILAALLGVFALAYLTWRFVEQPFRTSKVPRQAVLNFSVAGSAAILVLGGLGIQEDGFISRYDDKDRYLASFSTSEAGRYVEGRFNHMVLANFDKSSKLKVMLVGDSFAQDLVNAVYEAGANQNIQLSTFRISSQCGNLYIDDIARYVQDHNRFMCNKEGWFTNVRLRGLMQEADQIWLASDWQPWQAKQARASYDNLTKEFGDKVLVFGTKNFGTIKLRKLALIPASERLGLINGYDKGYAELNQVMSSTLPKFIDVSDLLCASATRCKIFLGNGALLSHDGGHLTKDGAKFYGEKLLGHPYITESLRMKPRSIELATRDLG